MKILSDETTAVLKPNELDDFLEMYCGTKLPLLVPEDVFNKAVIGLRFNHRKQPIVCYSKDKLIKALMVGSELSKENAAAHIANIKIQGLEILSDTKMAFDIEFKFTN